MTTSIPTFPDLAGKVAVLTGGSSEIGAQTAKFFAANGMKVAISGRDKDALQVAVDEIRAEGGEIIAVPADALNSVELDNLRETVERELGPVDVLGAFAGGDPGPAPLHEVTEADWRATIDNNLTTAFLTLKAFLPGMVERKSGSIITMSSAAGRLPGWSAYGYATAKAGILQLTRRIAQDVGKFGVRVNALAPSAILTKKQEAKFPAAVRDKVVEDFFVIPRWGTPTDCANAALFLASEASSWVTGTTTDIAGGKVMI
jgi:3-oxoacyl-[acyl-carrier protein] reductase